MMDARTRRRAAVYARISVEDSGGPVSVENQIALCRRYIEGQPELVMAGIYTDVGQSGTTFDRPGFRKMMEEAQKGKIQCIVVKDLSRFGRNYLECGIYLERIYPLWNLRFISVDDGYDSRSLDGWDYLGAELKSLIHEFYARDISEKVKAAKEARRKAGSFVGGIPAYGYRKQKTSYGYRLCPDPKASRIVRKIFVTYETNRSINNVSEMLYRERINPPKVYRCTGSISAKDPDDLKPWADATIRTILANPVYLGSLARRGRDLKSGEMICNAHEAIIPEALFWRVQKLPGLKGGRT